MEELTEQFQSDSRRRKTDMKGINAGTQRQQKSYMPFEQNSSHIYMGQKQNSNALFSKKDMRDIRRSVQTSWSELAGDPSGKTGNTQSYGESIRAQRQKAKDTSLSLKKLKYQFKSLSTKILRSKTSLAARQAAGQARREILRLKSQKQSGKYDNEELEAAIEHAKAMERVAKKKARHLEEEEMAKCVDAYMKSLRPVPSPYLVNGELSDKAKEGRKVFEKLKCGECHSGPYYTDMKMHRIGEDIEFEKGWDTPTLIEVWRTAPYLFDGRAATMEEVFEVHKHGIDKKVSKKDIEALTEYVNSL